MARILVGYSISGHDNGTTYIQNSAALAHCSACGARHDFFTHNPDYTMGRKRRGHLFYTYDEVPIVTQPFREFVLGNRYPDVSFLPFRNDGDRFHLRVDGEIPYDRTVPELELEEYCEACRRFNSVATGTRDLFLAVDAPLRDGIYRTDLLFGHGNNKGPLLIVGLETALKMKASGLKGIIFSSAFGVETRGK